MSLRTGFRGMRCQVPKASFAGFGGRNPVDRGRRGVKSIVIVDNKGAYIFIDLAAAHIHDSQLLSYLLSK